MKEKIRRKLICHCKERSDEAIFSPVISTNAERSHPNLSSRPTRRDLIRTCHLDQRGEISLKDFSTTVEMTGATVEMTGATVEMTGATVK
ncbi:MAG: hypothetical protein ABII13_01315 [Patescibacteria group bacterium]